MQWFINPQADISMHATNWQHAAQHSQSQVTASISRPASGRTFGSITLQASAMPRRPEWWLAVCLPGRGVITTPMFTKHNIEHILPNKLWSIMMHLTLQVLVNAISKLACYQWDVAFDNPTYSEEASRNNLSTGLLMIIGCCPLSSSIIYKYD